MNQPDTNNNRAARLKEENQKFSEEVKARQKAEYELMEAKDTMKAQSGSLERAWERHRATETALTEKNNEVARLSAEVQRAIEDRNRIGIEIRGEYLPKLKETNNEVARLMDELAELNRKHYNQKEYLHLWACCLDGLGAEVGYDGYRDHREVRKSFEKLLERLSFKLEDKHKLSEPTDQIHS